MNKIFNIAVRINLLICLFLICSCSKSLVEDPNAGSNSTDSYVNISFGTRSSIPSLEENKESGVQHLRVIIFDATGEKVSNTKYTATNAGRVPNPVIKVSGGQKYTIYTIANENNIPIANVLPNKYLTEVLDGVKKISDVEAVAVQLTLVDYSGLPNAGLLMVGSTEVDAKFGHSMIYPQDVSIVMKRLTSKITLNARRAAGMTVAIKKVVAKNVHQHEYLIAKSPDYTYPPYSQVASQNIPISVGENVSEGSSAVPFSLFNRYYLGTNYAGEKFIFSLDIIYNKTVGAGAPETDTITITIPSAVERNMEYTFNLNFLLSTVNVDFSVKDWDDQEIVGDVVAKTSLSLSQSELTMYGPHESTIYFQTDATNVEAELMTESGALVSNYFSKQITGSNGSGKIVLTPILSAMSPDPDKPTQIGLYFKAGNIRKLVRVTHINKDAYAVKLDANGGSFSKPTEAVRGDGTRQIGSGYTIKNISTLIPDRTLHTFLGWSLSRTALLKEFSPGDNVSYEDLERPKDLLTLYAVWGSSQRSSLVFDPNGKMARNMPGALSSTPGTLVGIPNNRPVDVDGSYVFLNWNTKADGTGTTYSNTGINRVFTLGTEMSVLYAIWAPRPVTVTLLTNYDVDQIVITYTMSQDAQFVIQIAEPYRPGWRFRGWNTRRLGDGTYYATNTAHPAPSTDLTLYAIWGVPRGIFHSYPFGYIVRPGNHDPYDKADVKLGERITLSGRLYFERNPWYRISPDQVFEGEKGKLSQRFRYWRDIHTNQVYYGPNDTFTMPDRDVFLEAVYENNIGTFEFWNWVGGTSFTYHIQRNYGQGWQQASSAHNFGYWGKVHYPPYPIGEDFRISIHSSWNPPPWYGVLVAFKNGTSKWHNHSKRPMQTTFTLITRNEIEQNGGIRYVKIYAAHPNLDRPANPSDK